MSLLSRFTFPAILVFVVAGINSATSGLYSGLASDAPALPSLLLSICSVWSAGWWLEDDLRRRGETWTYCLGLPVWIAWPLFLPYYLLKTRGRRAFISIAVFVAVSIAALVSGVVLGLLLA